MQLCITLFCLFTAFVRHAHWNLAAELWYIKENIESTNIGPKSQTWMNAKRLVKNNGFFSYSSVQQLLLLFS